MIALLLKRQKDTLIDFIDNWNIFVSLEMSIQIDQIMNLKCFPFNRTALPFIEKPLLS